MVEKMLRDDCLEEEVHNIFSEYAPVLCLACLVIPNSGSEMHCWGEEPRLTPRWISACCMSGMCVYHVHGGYLFLSSYPPPLLPPLSSPLLPSPPLPSPPSRSTLCDFQDECGDMYYSENDGLTYRFLTRRLYLRYTEDVSMPGLYECVKGDQ